MPQLAAQDDDVPFRLSAFFMNLEAKRRDAREKEKEEKKKMKKRNEHYPDGGGLCSGEVPAQFKLGDVVNVGDGAREEESSSTYSQS